jgi:hypothetical protein
MAESKSPFRALAPAVWLMIFVPPAIIFYFIHLYGVDVAVQLKNPGVEFSGFRACIPLRSVGPGVHEVAFSVLSHDRRALFTPHAVTLRIQ